MSLNLARNAIRQSIRMSSTTAAATATGASSLPVNVATIEQDWKSLSKADQDLTYKLLHELQAKDWKELSLDEKRASYYVAYGPHGPREPRLPKGSAVKTLGGVAIALVASGALFTLIRSLGQPKPKTFDKEWQEASNKIALEEKRDPFHGISSAGYKGKGYVQ